MTKAPKLSQLEPGYLLKTATQTKKQSSLNLGSFLQVLREPHRLPESARPFIVGDPVNLIDWKVFAKTDHLMVREIRPNSQVKVHILVDTSDHMYWPTEDFEDSIQKAEVALRTSFFLAYIHHRNGDSIQLTFVNKQSSSTEFVSFKPRNANQIIAKFKELSSNSWKLIPGKEGFRDFQTAMHQKKVDRLYFFSDGLSNFGKKEIPVPREGIFFHTLSDKERNFDWLQNKTCYFDGAEVDHEYTGENLKSDQNFKLQLENWTTSLKNKFGNLEFFPISEETTINKFFAELQRYSKNLNRN